MSRLFYTRVQDSVPFQTQVLVLCLYHLTFNENLFVCLFVRLSVIILVLAFFVLSILFSCSFLKWSPCFTLLYLLNFFNFLVTLLFLEWFTLGVSVTFYFICSFLLSFFYLFFVKHWELHFNAGKKIIEINLYSLKT